MSEMCVNFQRRENVTFLQFKCQDCSRAENLKRLCGVCRMKEGLVHIKKLRYAPDDISDIEDLRIFYDSSTGQYVHHWFCDDCGQDCGFICFDANLLDIVDEVELGYVCSDCDESSECEDGCLATMCQMGQGVSA